MAFTALANDVATSHAPSSGMLRRLLSAIMSAREAQAQYRVKSQLRDLPDDVLHDIGLRGRDIHKLRNGGPPMILHMG